MVDHSSQQTRVDSFRIARSELIVGGQKSGKSRRAEMLCREWLAQNPQHKALLIATAQPHDEEMRQRIALHQASRQAAVPGLSTLEEPLKLAETIEAHSHVHTLVVVDCLTLWLTNQLMPPEPDQGDFQVKKWVPELAEQDLEAPLLRAISHARGPIILITNEIGLGVIPLGVKVRQFVDALGRLNQSVAQQCSRVTFMAAGLPMTLKDNF